VIDVDWSADTVVMVNVVFGPGGSTTVIDSGFGLDGRVFLVHPVGGF